MVRVKSVTRRYLTRKYREWLLRIDPNFEQYKRY